MFSSLLTVAIITVMADSLGKLPRADQWCSAGLPWAIIVAMALFSEVFRACALVIGISNRSFNYVLIKYEIE